jgi:hypothetical protein
MHSQAALKRFTDEDRQECRGLRVLDASTRKARPRYRGILRLPLANPSGSLGIESLPSASPPSLSYRNRAVETVLGRLQHDAAHVLQERLSSCPHVQLQGAENVVYGLPDAIWAVGTDVGFC